MSESAIVAVAATVAWCVGVCLAFIALAAVDHYMSRRR